MYLAPLLNGQCLNDYPPRVEFVPEKIERIFETPLGNRRYHIIGFQYTFTLVWDVSLVTEAQWEVLRNIVNLKTTVEFIPFPDKYYNSSFTVQDVKGIGGLKPFKYIGNGYRGSMVLQTVSPVQTIPAWDTTSE